jgi:plasmid stabilization system protein ParE
MDLKWTSRAQRDLVRLHDFLDEVNPQAAAKVIRSLAAAPQRLLEHPRLGQRLEAFDPREVRRIFVGPYEIRYEIRPRTIWVVQIWHGREDR